jgi:hypothetical protein
MQRLTTRLLFLAISPPLGPTGSSDPRRSLRGGKQWVRRHSETYGAALILIRLHNVTSPSGDSVDAAIKDISCEYGSRSTDLRDSAVTV